MQKKQWLIGCSIFLGMLLITSISLQNGIQPGEGAIGASTEEETPDPIEFTVYINDSNWIVHPWGRDLTSRAIEHQTGVVLHIEAPVTEDEARTRIHLMISSQRYPDILILSEEDLYQKLLHSHALLPLNDMLETYGQAIRTYAGTEMIEEFCTEPDGTIYGLPHGFVPNPSLDVPRGSGMLVLESVYASLGEPPLKDIEDLYHYLLQVRNARRKNQAGDRIIPALLDEPVSNLAAWFGVPTLRISGGSYVLTEDMMLEHILRNASMQELFGFVNRLYREKMIDSEWWVQSPNHMAEKLLNGSVAVYFAQDVYTWMDELNGLMQVRTGDQYRLVSPGSSSGAEGFIGAYRGIRPAARVFLTTQCRDPVRAMEFLNWQSAPEGQYISRMGPRDIVWQLDAQGKPQLTQEYGDRLAEDWEKAYLDIGYNRWCLLRNRRYDPDIFPVFKNRYELEAYPVWTKILEDSHWSMPSLDRLNIDPSTLEGVANTRINIYYDKTDEFLYVEKERSVHVNRMEETLLEMVASGLFVVEEELNRQLKKILDPTRGTP